MKVLNEQKIRADTFRLKLEDHLLKRLIADAARDKLLEMGVEGVPDQLAFVGGQVEVTLKNESDTGYVYSAIIDIRLDRSEVATGTTPG